MCIKLPTKKTKPSYSMEKLSMLLYGAPKIGKSTFCSRAQAAIFIATEPGLNHLETHQVPVTTWEELLQAFALLENEEHNFKTIVIDTVDKAWDFCESYVCNRHKITHINDLGYGKGYHLLSTEFGRVFTKLFALGHGVILTSHAELKDVDTPLGKQTKWVPTFARRGQNVVLPMVDIIGFAQNEISMSEQGERIERRVLHTKTSALFEAGDRTNRLPAKLPFAYQVFEKALTAAPKIQPQKTKAEPQHSATDSKQLEIV